LAILYAVSARAIVTVASMPWGTFDTMIPIALMTLVIAFSPYKNPKMRKMIPHNNARAVMILVNLSSSIDRVV